MVDEAALRDQQFGDELTDLSANDFADEVARFYGLRRLNLLELLAATAVVQRF